MWCEILFCHKPKGLAIAFIIYAGSNDITSELEHTEKVVLHLMIRFLGSGHALFMDNYYSTFSLASKLLLNNTYCTGTMRKSRKHNPRVVIAEKLNKGQTICKYAEGSPNRQVEGQEGGVVHFSTRFEN